MYKSKSGRSLLRVEKKPKRIEKSIQKQENYIVIEIRSR